MKDKGNFGFVSLSRSGLGKAGTILEPWSAFSQGCRFQGPSSSLWVVVISPKGAVSVVSCVLFPTLSDLHLH